MLTLSPAVRRETQQFFVEEHTVIVPLTLQEILEEQIVGKLA